MNKEEIKVMIKDGVYSEDGITYMSDKQFNNYIDIIEQLQQENQELKKENKILRENAEHNDKVVDKVNWENLKLKEENKRLYKTIEELSEYQYDREEEDMMNYIIEQEEVFNDYSFMEECNNE